MNMRIDRTKTEACVGGIHGVSRGSDLLPAIWLISSRWRLSRLIFAARCLKISGVAGEVAVAIAAAQNEIG
jgi:hypothetical protein